MRKTGNRSPGRPKASDIDQPKQTLILQTATNLFLNHGYSKVSVDDIARACDITKATLYYYFPSKAALFTESMVAMMLRIKENVVRYLMADKPLKERLYDVALSHYKATTTFDMEGFMREIKMDLAKEYLQKIKAVEDEMYESIGEAIQKDSQEGHVKEINPMFAAHSFSSLLNVGHYQLKSGERLFKTPETAAHTIVNFFWDGLTAGL